MPNSKNKAIERKKEVQLGRRKKDAMESKDSAKYNRLSAEQGKTYFKYHK